MKNDVIYANYQIIKNKHSNFFNAKHEKLYEKFIKKIFDTHIFFCISWKKKKIYVNFI